MMDRMRWNARGEFRDRFLDVLASVGQVLPIAGRTLRIRKDASGPREPSC